ncbi:MAG: GNAT family N-acetyltransferase [Parasporobacterium sp.]|nr:GNAT family N-acetyltransferase [Parasporobacterium sp.]
MEEIRIVEVKTKSQLRKFVDLPNVMYRDVPQFIPAFYGDDLQDWDRSKNPAFQYCDARAFLAYRGDEIVGRIGAILSRRANEKWNTRRMRFTQVDFIDDPLVSSRLFETVEEWARQENCDELQGPLGFCDLDREGMLVEGFDRQSLFITYYNPPYYIEHLTRLGFVKDADWVEFRIAVPKEGDDSYNRISKVADMVIKRGHYHKADLSRRSHFKPYIRKVFELVNIAYADLYGTVELVKDQIEKYADKFVPLINPDYCCIVLDEQEELAGFGVCCPSVDQALKKSRGRLFPFGWIGLLRSLRKNTVVDLLLIAVRPELQGKGINAVILDHIMHSCIKNGIRYAESGPQLELNHKINSQWKIFPIEQHKRRRCFVKKLSI